MKEQRLFKFDQFFYQHLVYLLMSSDWLKYVDMRPFLIRFVRYHMLFGLCSYSFICSNYKIEICVTQCQHAECEFVLSLTFGQYSPNIRDTFKSRSNGSFERYRTRKNLVINTNTHHHVSEICTVRVWMSSPPSHIQQQ